MCRIKMKAVMVHQGISAAISKDEMIRRFEESTALGIKFEYRRLKTRRSPMRYSQRLTMHSS